MPEAAGFIIEIDLFPCGTRYPRHRFRLVATSVSVRGRRIVACRRGQSFLLPRLIHIRDLMRFRLMVILRLLCLRLLRFLFLAVISSRFLPRPNLLQR